MNRYLKYSKMRQVSIPDSRSLHLSDSNQSQESKQLNDTKDLASHDSSQQQKQEEEEEGGGGEMFGLVLSRSTSVSAHGVKAEKQNAVLDVAVRRAFSMRRSSSVSEGYCKIHHQTDAAASHEVPTTRIKKKRSFNLFKGCKLLFGF